MPTRRGRNHDDAASGVMPRRVKTKPKRAAVEGMRMSIGSGAGDDHDPHLDIAAGNHGTEAAANSGAARRIRGQLVVERTTIAMRLAPRLCWYSRFVRS